MDPFQYRMMVQVRSFVPQSWLSDIHIHDNTSEGGPAIPVKTVQELRLQLANLQQKTDQKENAFNETIKSLGAKQESSSVSIL